MTDRFMCDDAGSLIDLLTDKMYDYFEEVLPVLNQINNEMEDLRKCLYNERTNTVKVLLNYSRQFKRHTAEFSFMCDLAEDLGVNPLFLEANDD